MAISETPTPGVELPEPPDDGAVPSPKAVTIGAVCKALGQEFPDISISKIRYLEGQKLLSPRRTPGGYRVYTPADVQRLRTILRLQRDEFLPLRIIRQELAGGRTEPDVTHTAAKAPGGPVRRASITVRDPGAVYSLEDVLEDTGADARLVRELE